MKARDTFDILAKMVCNAQCKPGWTFRLVYEDEALRLVIGVTSQDAYDESRSRITDHHFPVPTATYNEKSWQRWIFEMCRRLENHELGEWFRVSNERPFAPLHGPGEDPYTVHEFRPYVDALTTQNGSIRKPA